MSRETMSSRSNRTTAPEEFRYVLSPSSLGSILLASGNKGIVAILIDEDDRQLLDALRARFPSASLVPGNREDRNHLQQIIDYIESPTDDLDLPLDMRGTAFQLKVWKAVRSVPVGETSTYADIARMIGAPRSARAVGTACASNPLAVAIPCHRILSSAGSISGGHYWGNERRRALLDREASR